MRTTAFRCSGCGRLLRDEEEVIEVAREWLYCTDMCAVTLTLGLNLVASPPQVAYVTA